MGVSAAVLDVVLHEGLPGVFTRGPGLIDAPLGRPKQIRMSLCLADKLVGIGVITHCEVVEFRQAVVFFTTHGFGDSDTFGGGRLP
jgi:hypothetical protein